MDRGERALHDSSEQHRCMRISERLHLLNQLRSLSKLGEVTPVGCIGIKIRSAARMADVATPRSPGGVSITTWSATPLSQDCRWMVFFG
ncbi:hypothetical protein ACFPRL_35220 [Pseudoclavibacter helvolus]